MKPPLVARACTRTPRPANLARGVVRRASSSTTITSNGACRRMRRRAREQASVGNAPCTRITTLARGCPRSPAQNGADAGWVRGATARSWALAGVRTAPAARPNWRAGHRCLAGPAARHSPSARAGKETRVGGDRHAAELLLGMGRTPTPDRATPALDSPATSRHCRIPRTGRQQPPMPAAKTNGLRRRGRRNRRPAGLAPASALADLGPGRCGPAAGIPDPLHAVPEPPGRRALRQTALASSRRAFTRRCCCAPGWRWTRRP